MKKTDIYFLLGVVGLFLPFFLFGDLYNAYYSFNKDHGIIMSVFKFGILATAGEMLGLRIKEGVYNKIGFGLIPKAIVWGVFGCIIAIAFKIFYAGAPAFCEYMGIENASVVLKGPLSLTSILISFSIATSMNLIFGPVLMTSHKIVDCHIHSHGGTISSLIRPIHFSSILSKLDWNIQWNFVFKKTIPLFWIPAHTVVFLLPVEFQILMAALLGVVLGAILSFAALNPDRQPIS